MRVKSFVLTLIAAVCFQLSADEVKVLRLAHSLDTKHPVHKGMAYMARRVAEKSNGSLVVEIYPGGQLGTEKESIEALQLGYLAMTKTSTASMESFVPEYRVFGMPYLFRDEAHFWKVCLGPIGRELLDAGVPKRLKGLCYYDAGARSFYAKKPIESPADLSNEGKTLKVRVQNSLMAREMVATLGGVPTPIPWGELYTALDQGVVDAAENNPPSLLTSRHYEICSFYSLDEHVMVPDILIISVRIWERLSGEHKRILQEAVDESVEYQRKAWDESVDEAMKVFKENGVTVIRPDKAPFIEAVKPMWEKYEKSEIGGLMKKIREVK